MVAAPAPPNLQPALGAPGRGNKNRGHKNPPKKSAFPPDEKSSSNLDSPSYPAYPGDPPAYAPVHQNNQFNNAERQPNPRPQSDADKHHPQNNNIIAQQAKPG